MKYFAVLVLMTVLLGACGSREEGSSGDAAEAGPGRMRLVVRDSIGVGMGDSLYMFGTVDALAHGPDGEVLVLDGMRKRIGRYSPRGEFMNPISREGEGPGELLRPSSMALIPGRGLAVNDLAQSRITFFDQQGLVREELDGFTPFPPTRMRASSAGVVGTRRDFDREANRYGFRVGLWTDSTEMDLVYHSRMTDFNRDNIQETVNATNIAFTASPFDGRVYVAPVSTVDYRIFIYAVDGTPEGEITRSRPRVRRPQREIDRERAEQNRQLREEGAPPDMVWEPREYENQVSALWVGPENRLWARDGTAPDPLFHVYSPAGDLLFECRLEGPAPADGDLLFSIDAGGFLATQSDPLDFPRVYILSLQEE